MMKPFFAFLALFLCLAAQAILRIFRQLLYELRLRKRR